MDVFVHAGAQSWTKCCITVAMKSICDDMRTSASILPLQFTHGKELIFLSLVYSFVSRSAAVAAVAAFHLIDSIHLQTKVIIFACMQSTIYYARRALHDMLESLTQTTSINQFG